MNLTEVIRIPLKPYPDPPNLGKAVTIENLDVLDLDPIVVDVEMEENCALALNPIERDKMDVIILGKHILRRKRFKMTEGSTILDIAMRGGPGSWYSVFKAAYEPLARISIGVFECSELSIGA